VRALSDCAGRVASERMLTCRDLELVNFMCHSHFRCTFNPRVTFITGKNGSGKSAIATAICMAFGMQSRTLGRGGAGSVVREHFSEATIRLRIANEGTCWCCRRHCDAH
jgi:structural maintenance of chromosomes protein 6